jgi:hypothetical protein
VGLVNGRLALSKHEFLDVLPEPVRTHLWSN